MGKRRPQLQPDQIAFIGGQKVFFAATSEGRVNLSAKRREPLRLLSSTLILWPNRTGSGKETAADPALCPRMTLM
jgi:hypothetical protein